MDYRGMKRCRMAADEVKPLGKQNVQTTPLDLEDPDLPADIRAHKLKAYKLYADSLQKPATKALHLTFIAEQMREYNAVLAPFFDSLPAESASSSSMGAARCPEQESEQEAEQEAEQDTITRQAAEIVELQAQLQAMRLAAPAAAPAAAAPADPKWLRAQAIFEASLKAKCRKKEDARQKRNKEDGYQSDDDSVSVDCGLGDWRPWCETSLDEVRCLCISPWIPGPVAEMNEHIHETRGHGVDFRVRAEMRGFPLVLRCSAYALRHWGSAREYLCRRPAYFRSILEFAP